MPDYFVWHAGRTVGIELKREDGVLSVAQKAMHPMLWAAGVPVYVCRSAEDVVECLDLEHIPMQQNYVNAILREKRNGNERTTQSGAA